MQCITRWIGIGGIGISGFSYIHVWITRPATYKKLTLYFVEKNIGMFRPHLDTFIGRVGRGGIGITGFSYIHVLITRPATYKKLTLYFVEKNIVMFRPHLDTFIGLWHMCLSPGEALIVQYISKCGRWCFES